MKGFARVLFLSLTAPFAWQPGVSAQALEANQTVDPALFDVLSFRPVGPFRGGRVTAVGGFADRPYTFAMGTTGGGVWITEDAGQRWKNVTDGFLDVGSIGAVEVAPGDANVIYVGTGSACPRGNVSIGRGMWRSTDRGRTWTSAGLPESGSIARIQVDPRDPDRVFVAALGNPFGRNEERGVYRSIDGGTSWDRVLFVSDSTGAVDLAMNPHNPREIYAAFWRSERKPWTLIDASTDGGIWKSVDGGDTWDKLGGGLPEGLTGRIGITISPADPDRVWALVNAKDPDGGIYRSDDAGETWKKINRDRRFRQRHWYYSHMIADPADANTVYVLNTGMYRSIDGGSTWESIRVPHGDVHALWIHPGHPDRMVVGNDGGAQVSLNGGESWSTMYNQPTAEFYRLEVDNGYPYRLYGAQQDNSTISVPSDHDADLHPMQAWQSVGGSESGHISVNRTDPDDVWAGNYIGQIDRSDLESGYRRDVIIYPQMQDGTAPRDLRYRFQWNAPIQVSTHDPNTVYHASNHVHRTTNGGMSWQTISPDLTTDNDAQQGLPGGPLQHDHTGVEVYNTIFVLEESPDTPMELWAGSDDGRVHYTIDGGASWTDITPADMPPGGTVNSIDLLAGRPGRAVMAVYRYRENDFRPYVFLTEDFGARWRLLTNGTNGIPADHPVRVVRQDPDRPQTLFAGTEFGLFVSFDEGKNWQALQLKLPRTPITDLAVHGDDLVIATQGRSFWILDDLHVLRAVADQSFDLDVSLLPIGPATLARISGYRGDAAPQNRESGVVIVAHVAESVAGPVKLEIVDSEGAILRRFEGSTAEEESSPGTSDSAGDVPPDDALEPDPAANDGVETEELDVKPGLNRFTWDRRAAGPDVLEDAKFSLATTDGMYVPPGRYTVRISAAGTEDSASFDLLPDPRFTDITSSDLDRQYDLAVTVRDRLTEVHEAVRTIRSSREQMDSITRRLADAGYDGAWVDSLDDTRTRALERFKDAEEALIQTRSESGQDPINFPPMLDDQLAYLYSHIIGAYGPPTDGDRERFGDLNTLIQPLLDEVGAVLSGEIADFERILADHDVPAVIVPKD